VRAGLAVAAAPASALPLPPLTINGAAPSANGPKVNARQGSQEADGGGGALYILTVSFPSSNDTGDEITAVSGAFNSSEAANGHGIISVDEEVGNADPGALFSVFANGSPGFTPGGEALVVQLPEPERPNAAERRERHCQHVRPDRQRCDRRGQLRAARASMCSSFGV
jgi:hypothetical protein